MMSWLLLDCYGYYWLVIKQSCMPNIMSYFSPSTISIQPISQYEINRSVKPIFVNDSIFFIVNRSGYSALMEMNKNTITASIKAEDVSSHVAGYIDENVSSMVCIPRSNIIFIGSNDNKNDVFVYKYHAQDSTKAQSAWSKWVFNVDIASLFCFDNYLYICGGRYDIEAPVDSYPLLSNWDDIKVWSDTTYWLETGYSSTNTIEKIDVDAYNLSQTFADNGTIEYNSEIELSEWSMANSDGAKELQGNLLIKTIDVSTQDGSDFLLIVEDKERGTSRGIPSEYTVGRKPFVSGNSKNIILKIVSNGNNGFQVKSITLEGQYNVRSKRV